MFTAAVAAKGPEFVKQTKGVIMYVLTAGPDGKSRARSHCRCVLPLIHFTPDSLS